MKTIDQDSPSAHEARLRKHLETMTGSNQSDLNTDRSLSLPWQEESGWSTPNVFTEVTNSDFPADTERTARDSDGFSAADERAHDTRVSCVEQIDIREVRPGDRVSRLKTDSDPPGLRQELRKRMFRQLSDADDVIEGTEQGSLKKTTSTTQRESRWKLLRSVQVALSKAHRGVLISVALIAVLVGFFLVSLSWPNSDDSVESTPITDSEPMADSSDTTIVVSVAGAVENPGVVEVPEGSRVADAIEEAGGLLDETDPGLLNLARVLNDGDLIAVEDTKPDADGDDSVPTETNEGGGAVNVNAADPGTLVSLNGVGPVLAERIVDYREEHGSFQSVDDLLNVSGIGPAMLEKIRDEVVL